MMHNGPVNRFDGSSSDPSGSNNNAPSSNVKDLDATPVRVVLNVQ